jgi:hypothetical protein
MGAGSTGAGSMGGARDGLDSGACTDGRFGVRSRVADPNGGGSLIASAQAHARRSSLPMRPALPAEGCSPNRPMFPPTGQRFRRSATAAVAADRGFRGSAFAEIGPHSPKCPVSLALRPAPTLPRKQAPALPPEAPQPDPAPPKRGWATTASVMRFRGTGGPPSCPTSPRQRHHRSRPTLPRERVIPESESYAAARHCERAASKHGRHENHVVAQPRTHCTATPTW